jgi:hypothetical protein
LKPFSGLRVLPVKIAHQIKYEQYDEYEAESTAASGWAPVGVSAAPEEKNDDNDNKE